MRRPAPACALALLAMGLLRGITALKLRMTPMGEELVIQEGDDLMIECKGEGRLQFSTQKNLAHVKQSKFHISFNHDSGSYTFIRSKARKKDTGWYACAEEGIEIRNDELTIDHPDVDISWIYVYVNSSKPFASEDGVRWVSIPVVQGRSVVIPCRSTSPNLPVILVISKDDGEGEVEMTKIIEIYNPKIGFIIYDINSLEFLQDRIDSVHLRCEIDGTSAKSAEYYIVFHTPTPRIRQGGVVPMIVNQVLTLDCDFEVPAAEMRYNSILTRLSSIGLNWEGWHLQLTIQNVKKNDSGDYSCVVEDPSQGMVWKTKVTVLADSDGNSANGESSHNTASGDTSVAIDDDSFEPVQVFNYEGDFTNSDLKPIGTLELLCWAWQISRGMNYLSSKRVVHGDLAARTIFLADNNVVKICDFGLGKSLLADDIYKKSGNGPLRVKWMSVEAIGDRVFSIKSDVWSYGIVLWEFFVLAATPYPGITNEDVYQKLVGGFRMERPKYATEDIYRVMLKCWDAEPSKRPSFGEIEDIIDGLLDGKSKEHYTDFDVVYDFEINAKELADGRDYLTMTPAEYVANTAETAV